MTIADGFPLMVRKVSGVRFQVSGFSGAANRRGGQFDRKRDFVIVSFKKTEYRTLNAEHQIIILDILAHFRQFWHFSVLTGRGRFKNARILRNNRPDTQ
jgi:hypothetical protein